MERYAPHYKDLAPRDYVSRCMTMEILPDAKLPWGGDRAYPDAMTGGHEMSRRVFMMAIAKEMEIALPILFARCPELKLAEAPQYSNSYHFHGLTRLWVQQS